MEIVIEQDYQYRMKIQNCAIWLQFCLSIGYEKSDLDQLEKLWMDNHDYKGRYVPTLQKLTDNNDENRNIPL